jgi:anthranilate phosphoribosyltransferase
LVYLSRMTDAPFSTYVRALARGPGRARHLTREEAADAMARMLAGGEAAEAVGALLMLMRYRGENGEEVAGFVDAMRARLTGWRGLAPGLDWPSYAAGRSRGAPWFLLSALLIGRTGTPVLMHGFNSHMTHPLRTDAAVAALGLPLCRSPDAAKAALGAAGFAYVPLDALNADLLRLLQLRRVFGLRSPVNTCLKALNPGGAPASVQGVFHPAYRDLQQDAAAILGLPRLVALKGGGGEAERNPAKAQELFRVTNGAAHEEVAPPLIDAGHRRHSDTAPDAAHFLAVWRGEAADAYAEATVIGTAAIGLLAAGAPDLAGAERDAARLWRERTPA